MGNGAAGSRWAASGSAVLERARRSASGPTHHGTPVPQTVNSSGLSAGSGVMCRSAIDWRSSSSRSRAVRSGVASRRQHWSSCRRRGWNHRGRWRRRELAAKGTPFMSATSGHHRRGPSRPRCRRASWLEQFSPRRRPGSGSRPFVLPELRPRTKLSGNVFQQFAVGEALRERLDRRVCSLGEWGGWGWLVELAAHVLGYLAGNQFMSRLRRTVPLALTESARARVALSLWEMLCEESTPRCRDSAAPTSHGDDLCVGQRSP